MLLALLAGIWYIRDRGCGARNANRTTNLLFALLTGALAIFLFARGVKKPKEERNKHFNIAMFASALLAAGSVVLFVLTQDLRQPMHLFDAWTVWMGALAAAQIMVLVCYEKLMPKPIVEEKKQDKQ